MKLFSGKANNIDAPIILEVTRSNSLLRRQSKAYISHYTNRQHIGFGCIISNSDNSANKSRPTVILNDSDIKELSDGSFVHIDPSGVVSVIWDTLSHSNSIFLTPACNCKCVMCPQPPQPHDDECINTSINLIERLDSSKTQVVCITGGEPTLDSEVFLDLIARIKKRLDNALIMVLTNGKSFSDYSFAKEFASINLSNCILCVSLHSDISELNDKIAGSSGSFDKTVQGLYNLARFKQRIEIRHVISKFNANRLNDFSWFLYRNFPFAYHVAFMGMEVTGYALENYDKLWIDPYEYKVTLSSAVQNLHRALVNVSVYNIPHCLLEERTWKFARKSISDWKNKYLDCCAGCNKLNQCCGVFSTSGNNMSSSICKI